MGTRSRIAKEDTTGKVTMIYCHWDGYLENNGKLLLENYQDEKKIDQLLALGDISSLGSKLGKKHDFDARVKDTVTAYGRDRGEKGTEAKVWDALVAIPEDYYEEYFYLRRDGKWFYSSHGTFTELRELTAKAVKGTEE